MWYRSVGGAPVAAFGTRVYIAGNDGVTVASVKDGATLTNVGRCGLEDTEALVASRFGVLIACGDRSTGDADLIAAAPDGRIRGRSLFKAGVVDGAFCATVSTKTAWLYGVSSGATLDSRLALVNFTNAKLIAPPEFLSF